VIYFLKIVYIVPLVVFYLGCRSAVFTTYLHV